MLTIFLARYKLEEKAGSFVLGSGNSTSLVGSVWIGQGSRKSSRFTEVVDNVGRVEIIAVLNAVLKVAFASFAACLV